MPHEHEVPGIETEPWRDSKRRSDDALAPAAGISVAVLIATMMWAFLAWLLDEISLLAAAG